MSSNFYQSSVGDRKKDKLYPNYINPKTVKWGQKHVSVGGLGDSFYEYLIKTYIYTTEKDTVALEMYNDALDGIREHLVRSVFFIFIIFYQKLMINRSSKNFSKILKIVFYI